MFVNQCDIFKMWMQFRWIFLQTYKKMMLYWCNDFEKIGSKQSELVGVETKLEDADVITASLKFRGSGWTSTLAVSALAVNVFTSPEMTVIAS